MPVDDPKLLRERAAQCRHFARSAQVPDVADMLSRLADSFVERALRAERGLDISAYPVIGLDSESSVQGKA
jgi:hypothetical protein